MEFARPTDRLIIIEDKENNNISFFIDRFEVYEAIILDSSRHKQNHYSVLGLCLGLEDDGEGRSRYFADFTSMILSYPFTNDIEPDRRQLHT